MLPYSRGRAPVLGRRSDASADLKKSNFRAIDDKPPPALDHGRTCSRRPAKRRDPVSGQHAEVGGFWPLPDRWL